MDAKLTLKLDQTIIDHAKSYAKENHVSLSKLIENYLSSLTTERKQKSKVSPLVESLTGVIPNKVQDGKDYGDYLTEKYS